MESIQFTDDLCTGDEGLDNEHRLIYFLANNLQGSIHGGSVPVDPRTYVNILKAHVARHFSHEEEYMTRHAYADLESHKQEHQKFARTVEDLEARLLGGSLTREGILTVVGDWLDTHIRDVDRTMIQAVKVPFPAAREPGD